MTQSRMARYHILVIDPPRLLNDTHLAQRSSMKQPWSGNTLVLRILEKGIYNKQL